MKCRHCGADMTLPLIDLGSAPPSNAYLTPEKLHSPELWFPLRVLVCQKCWLVQTEDFTQADELFNAEYAYFSSTSKSWLAHAAQYSQAIIKDLGLNSDSFVIEIASNDGYLLKNFVKKEIPCLGIEPTASTAAVAEKLGIPVLREFFGEPLGQRLADQGQQANLIVGNNVYAHVPDINDFTRGLKAALKPGGTITLEFPHVMKLIQQVQFDTIYHEHFSYLSLYTVNKIFNDAGLKIWDTEELSTHGGSLRVYGCHKDDRRSITGRVQSILDQEATASLQNPIPYQTFQERANTVKNHLISFLVEQKRKGKQVAAYGAAAKGNTLLNYAGIKPDLLPYICDASPAKQGKFMPGSRIPVVNESQIKSTKPSYVVILPWNLKKEIMLQLEYIRDWGGKLVLAIPQMEVI
ncbi:class I SAM-dependent methyltransferase [Candidatus Synechococcus calcipolaris G9]|uniref:Class I SAM-dependent methyltransferase n=1 Tax=Candidatus Synechococcus calcipolaris G9 TaxID=1497997 RepID=A0ABT6EUP8_9SYNE|nr:class I SAM-dependent methyltransferase [Candidatus Synechococcus calcipolaris]MDG2989558.1 class I SAM-dependent methyltransferase [Candidatus Synechococcus calcipolaris G9]